MQRLFEKNQGFESRVRYHFDFPNYSIDELMELAKLMMKGLDMKPTLKAQEKLRILLEEKARYDGHVKGNGRTVRNIIDAIHVNQNNRISDMNIDDFETVLPEDIPTE
ncbi:type VII secretion AAA-ATPase EccA [Mycobacterium tuberculosis]|nr:type VII secretion AAA-ATPase EccA [Mycobacterium tuberculosis]